jgi:hypothetical protein
MGGTVLHDNVIALVNVDGEIMISRNDGVSFVPYQSTEAAPLSDIVELRDRGLFVTGLSGVNHISLK